MKKTTFFILMALLPVVCSAQQWGLEQCIDYALKNNIQVKQAEINVSANKLNVDQAKFNYLPSLSASSGYNMSFGRSLDQTTYQYVDNKVGSVNSSVSLGTQLFAGMNKLYSVQKSQLNLLATQSDAELLKNDISLAVAAAYLQILFGKESVANSKSQIAVLEQQLDQMKKKVQAGSVAIGSQLELEAQLATERYNLVTSQNTLQTALLDMTQLLELKDAPTFDIVIPNVSKIISEPVISDVQQVNQTAQDLPQIKGSELRLKIAEKEVRLAQSRYFPTLSLGMSYGSSFSDSRQKPVLAPNGTTLYEKYPFFDQYSDNASSSINFSLSIPIFNGLTVRRNVSQARLGVISGDLSVKQAKDKLYKQIQTAHNDATGSLSRYQSAEVSVSSSAESFRNVSERFANGSASSLDYVTAKNTLISSQSLMLQAKYEYIFRIKVLDFYQGIPLTL